MRLTFVALSFLAFAGCSNVAHVYKAPGYESLADTAVKRIIVGGWSPEAAASPVLARVAGDFVKLRKDYIVVETLGLTRGWEEGCKENIQGVLLVRALETAVQKDEVRMSLATELYRCGDGALLWRAEGDGDADPADDNLTAMVTNYANELGDAAKTYAAPAFVILQDVLNALPNVKLNDQEVEEKIEIGHIAEPAVDAA